MAKLSDTEIRDRLLNDTLFYAEKVVKVVTGAGKMVPLLPRPGQVKLETAMQQQEAAGKPIRIIDLKSRKVGHSTWTQTKFLQRATQRSHWKGLTIAHDKKTVGELFDIGFTAYSQLPDDPVLALKPAIINHRRQNYLHFGESSRMERAKGNLGLDSSLTVDTANEFEAGRGFTVQGLHCSEVAFWPDIGRKLLALLNTVTEAPETMIVLESTANGMNEFKDRWDDAVSGKSDYIPVFVGWLEDPECIRPFLSGQEREDFEALIGDGVEGEDEPDLQSMGATSEQLNWRRWAIHNKAGGDIRKFKQEYPASPDEAFLATGRTVFPSTYVIPAITKAELLPDPVRGLLTPGGTTSKNTRTGTVDVPTSALWVPKSATGFSDRAPLWEVWTKLENDAKPAPPKDAYVVSLDPADDSEVDEDSGQQDAYHAITVINQSTREQEAQLECRGDPDWIAEQVLLAALFFHRAIVAVEVTGGYGGPIARHLANVVRYNRMFYRRNLQNKKEKKLENLGWDTNVRTKPHIEAHFLQMLREGTHGIRSPRLARQMLTYVIDARGRHKPQRGSYTDLLMSFMIGQFVAQDEPVRVPGESTGSVDMVKRPYNPITGYPSG